MKRRLRLVLVILMSILVFQPKLYAVCDDEELNNIAEDLDVTLVEDVEIIGENNTIERERNYLYFLSFGESLKGMKNKVKVEVTDSETSEKYEGFYDDFFDTYVIGSLIHFEKKTYNIDVYGGSESKCPGEKIKTITRTVNAYNTYRDTEYCEEHIDEDICAIDYDSSSLDTDGFNNLIEENNQEESLIGNIWSFIKTYWYFVVIPVVVISLFYIVIITIYKKKGSK